MKHVKQHPVLSAFKFIFSMCLVVMLFWVCTSQDKKKGGDDAIGSFKMNCVILTKAQVQAWVDSGWTKPDNPNKIKKILLQFYSLNVSDVGNNMQLLAYPGKSITNVYPGGKQTLMRDTICSKTFSGPAAFGNNSLNIDDLKIINPDGSLNDFDFVRFIPTQQYAEYINFNIEIVRLGKTEVLSAKTSWPCPPYCGE